MHASFRFAQSVNGVALTVIGMGTEKELEQNVEWAKTFKPLTVEEANELKKKTVALAKEWGLTSISSTGRGRRAGRSSTHKKGSMLRMIVMECHRRDLPCPKPSARKVQG